jgi:hypothetical protein
LKKFQQGSIQGTRRQHYLDPDDSGPLSPVLVTCDYVKNDQGLTEIETIGGLRDGIQILPPIEYTGRFSYKKDILYTVY